MYLRKAIETAENLAESQAIRMVPPPFILAMDKKTMSELRSYAKPAPLVHRVMQAVFLFFNEEEDKTSVSKLNPISTQSFQSKYNYKSNG